MFGKLRAWWRRKEYYQQGDIQLFPHEIPKHASLKTNKHVVEHGEKTGHAHKLEGNNFQFYESRGHKYLRIVKPTNLRHEEHDKIVVPPGDYKVGKIETEDPFSNLRYGIYD